MEQAQQILTSCGKFRINLGLERIKALLKLLNNPQNSFKSIHVAGTNGKGSVCKMINDILIENFRDTDVKIGLFTSPHLFSYTERIKINNQNISDYVFNFLINDINVFSKKHNIDLTEFELITAAAFYYFYIKKTDWAVIEVGLGGKYDATNVINSAVSVITTVDFDHTERLGNTIEKIAEQKAGIIKKNSKVIVSPFNLGFDVIKKTSEENDCELITPKPPDNNIKLNLSGVFQKENMGLALCAVNNLGVDIKKEAVKEALKNVEWKFRMDFDKEKNLLTDGAHNPSGIKVLRQYLDENFQNEKKTFIFGCLKNKDYKTMLAKLLRQDDDFYFFEFDYPNALKFDELPENIKQRTKKLSTVDEIIKTIKEIKSLKIICGSLYMSGKIFADDYFAVSR